MLNQVRKLLRDRSPDWLNTEVNKNLLQNLTTNRLPSYSLSSQERARERSREVERSPEQVKPSLNESYIAKNPSLPTANCQLPTAKGTPHWRRIKQVFETLDTAPKGYTYNQLIEYVREATGKGCSRKLISKWKKQRNSKPQNSTTNRAENKELKEVTSIDRVPMAIALDETTTPNLSTACPRMGINRLHLIQKSDKPTSKNSLLTVNYLLLTAIAVGLVGCEIIPFNDRPTENAAIASVTAPITPLTPIPERRKNRLEPRSIKIELTLSNPTDLKVKPGDEISAGQVLSDRRSERNRLQAKKKQLQLSLEKLNLPLTPIPQPKPIPEIATLPPVSYAEAEADIKLKQQKLTEAERAIALQQKKIDSLKQLNAKPAKNKNSKASPFLRGTEGDLKLILEHERANLANLEAAKDSAQIQLEVAQSKLTTAKERRAYIEYQRNLEQTRRAIAVEQQQQAIQRQESERERLLAEREYSQAQIETQIQTLDYQIHQLSTVRAPYEGTIKKVKWTGQSDHNLTAVVTLAVNSDRPILADSTSKPTPNTEVKQTTKAQP